MGPTPRYGRVAPLGAASCMGSGIRGRRRLYAVAGFLVCATWRGGMDDAGLRHLAWWCATAEGCATWRGGMDGAGCATWRGGAPRRRVAPLGAPRVRGGEKGSNERREHRDIDSGLSSARSCDSAVACPSKTAPYVSVWPHVNRQVRMGGDRRPPPPSEEQR